mgnify:CR=1 FL=1
MKFGFSLETSYGIPMAQVMELAAEGKFHYEDGSAVDFTGMSRRQIRELVNAGKVFFNEDDVMNLREKTPRQIRELGVRLSFVPEDRLGMGLVGSMDIIDNMMLRSYRRGKSMFLERKAPKDLAKKIIEEFRPQFESKEEAIYR